MYIRYKPLAVFWRIVIALGGTVALLFSFDVFSGHPDYLKFKYFENIVGIITVFYYYILSFWQINDSKNEKSSILLWLKSIIMMNMCLICLVSIIIVHKGEFPKWSEYFIPNILHYILPLMIVIDWVLFDQKGSFKTSFPFIWCIPSWVYLIFAYILALVASKGNNYNYPYDFMTSDSGNWGTTIALLVTLNIAFILLGYLFVGFDKLPATFSNIASKIKPKAQAPADDGGG